MSEPTKHAVFASSERCFQCGTPMHRIAPPLYGWSYYCTSCKHLTSTKAELEAAMDAKPEGALGIVSAYPIELEIEPLPPYSTIA